MADTFSVVVEDSNGKKFSQSWKSEADKRDAIRWTITSEDLVFVIDQDKIVQVRIEEDK